MSRRRSAGDEQDSLDLLLDTVSNVFGGVMFLTLLAALLIISRGSVSPEEASPDSQQPPPPRSTTLLEAEARQTAVALEVQKKTQAILDPEGTVAEQAARLESIEQTLSLARRHARRVEDSVDQQQQALADQEMEQSDLEEQIEELQEQVSERSKVVNQARAQSERSVEFRPLTQSLTDEAVVILRYGRWYLLQTGPTGGGLNREDFFVLENSRSLARVTPKPHRGQPVSSQTLPEMTRRLKSMFSPRNYHVVVAVWDDSFAEFNPLKDSLKSAGYQYRTLPCDSSTRLSNMYAADAYVQ